MINKMILGTVQFGLNYGITNTTGKIEGNELDKIFEFCDNNKIYYFDTAQDYGDSENIILKYKQKFTNFQIITKAKFLNKDIPKTIDISVAKFEYINYFLLHSFTDYDPFVIEQLKKNKAISKIGKIGVSVYTVEEAIMCLKDLNIDCIQIPFNYLDRQWFNEEFQKLISYRKIEIHVRSIFLQGILLNPIKKYPLNISIDDFNTINNKIDNLCTYFNLSRLELCFAYINSFDWITKFLIGIDNYQHLLLNYDIINKNLKLTEEQINIIHNKLNNINPLITNPSKWIF